MGQRFYITKDIEVKEFEAVNEWGYPRHKHHFFELTFVLRGRGQHLLNDSIIDYREGDLFFLIPSDEHEFVIGEPTTFGIIKFTEQLLLEKASYSSSASWSKNIESVIKHSNMVAKSILKRQEDREQLFGLYRMIRNEVRHPGPFGHDVLMELFGALLVVLSRNLRPQSQSVLSDQDRVDSLLGYIRQNVLDKDRIKVEVLAKTFHLSPNYVGEFVKRHTGIPLQQYVMETKVKMAESLLRQSSLSIKEISDKMGFVDASHFNKIFKKYTGKNPSSY